MAKAGGRALLVCGAGRVVEKYYAEALLRSPDFRVEGVVETSGERRRWAGERFGARTYDSVAEALARGSFAAGLVVTPPQAQHEISLALLAKGVAVLTEKPGARTEAEAEQLLAAANGAPLRLGLARRYWRRYDVQLQGGLESWSIEIETDPEAWGHLDASQSRGLDGLIDDLLPHAYDIAGQVLGCEAENPAEASWDGETLRIGFREGEGSGQRSRGAISISHGKQYRERVIWTTAAGSRPVMITSEKSVMSRLVDRLARREDEQVEAIGRLLASFAKDIEAGETNDDLRRCTKLIARTRELLAGGK